MINLNSTTVMFIPLVVIMVLVIICFIITLINSSKVNTLMDYAEEGDLITVIKEYYDKVYNLSTTIAKSTDTVILSKLANCEKEEGLALKKTGIVNFDAFDDVKGNLSFSIAILNNHNDGFILTSLYGHNSCNTYVREISGGETSIKLLNEEREALLKAKNNIRTEENDDEE